MIHRSAAAALGVVWKLYFSRNTSVLSAIEMLHDIVLYKFNIHIHILEDRCCILDDDGDDDDDDDDDNDDDDDDDDDDSDDDAVN